jgi:NAD(P)H-flavin reductase
MLDQSVSHLSNLPQGLEAHGVHTALEQPLRPRPWRVESYRSETYDTFTLTMSPEDCVHDFSFKPGQFNMVYVYGVGESPISISGDPAKPEKLTHTVRAVGTTTNAMSKLRRGSVLGLRGPYGSSWPVDEARGKDVIIVAGGIGLPPLTPALLHILNNRLDYGRVSLCYGARTPQDLLYTRELERWRSRLDLNVTVTVDAAADIWRGNVGLVTTLLSKAYFDPNNTVAMIVGPEIMMRFCILELQGLGIPSEGVYISMERSMKCGIGFCGHCQLGPTFVCKDGPVYRYDTIAPLLETREL